MLPRWFRLLVAVELAGIITLVVLGVHLARSGVQVAGDIISWARPAVTTPAPSVSAVPVAPPHAALSPATGAAPSITSTLLHRLDSDTATAYTEQSSIIGELERLLRTRIEAILAQAAAGH